MARNERRLRRLRHNLLLSMWLDPAARRARWRVRFPPPESPRRVKSKTYGAAKFRLRIISVGVCVGVRLNSGGPYKCCELKAYEFSGTTVVDGQASVLYIHPKHE
jgi:hypothetical protein